MSAPVVAFLFATGFMAWVYSKVQRSTGGNTQNSIIVSVIAWIFAFVAFLLVLGAVDRALQ